MWTNKNIIAVFIILSLSACKKDEGKGGNSTIKGKVIVQEYTDVTFTDIYAEHPGLDEDVYIIYGGETGVGDNTKTAPDGSFEFKYLRKGTYKVFIYSKDKVNATPFYVPDTAIINTVEITDKKQTVDAGILIMSKVIN